MLAPIHTRHQDKFVLRRWRPIRLPIFARRVGLDIEFCRAVGIGLEFIARADAIAIERMVRAEILLHCTVSDQKPSNRGNSPLLRCGTYLFTLFGSTLVYTSSN